MSRSQSTTTFNTAQGEQGTNNSEAQQNEQNAENDIGQYSSALAKYAASNPYVQGGEYQTDQNQSLSNTADANSASTAAELQQQAERTGQNANAANATAASNAQANERNLASQEGTANAQRIGNEAEYNTDVMNDESKPEQMQEQLAALQQGAANNELGAMNTAAGANKSFGDEFGEDFAGSLGTGLGNLATGNTKGCWIAAELYGGWDDPRTKLLRFWIFGPYLESGWIPLLLASAYARFGERLIPLIRRSRRVRQYFQRIFDEALRRAEQWQRLEGKRGY